jgi:Trm5-related predicted tRNA methylase
MNENSTTTAEPSIVGGIARQKRVEKGITARKSRYQRVIAASGQLLREHDVITGDMIWGDCLARVLGYSLDEIRG